MARNQFGGFGGPNMQQLMRQAQKMQQDMVMAAVNEALRQGEENREKTMSALAPAGMGGMF